MSIRRDSRNYLDSSHFFSDPRHDNLIRQYRQSFLIQECQIEELKAKWVYRAVWAVIIGCMGCAYYILKNPR